MTPEERRAEYPVRLTMRTRNRIAESAPWPTPTAKGNGNRSEYGGKSGDGLDTAVKRGTESAPWPTPCTHDRLPGTTKPHGFIIDGKEMQRNLNDTVVRRELSATGPTPCTTGLDGGSNSRKAARERGRYIEGAAKSAPWPTPTRRDYRSTDGKPHGRGDANLNDEVVRRAKSATGPTPCARDAAGCSPHEKERDKLCFAIERGKTKSHLYPTVGTKTMGGCSGSFAKLKHLEEIGRLTAEERRAMSSHLTGGKDPDKADVGMLNPDWVEWLMGWPIWWTDLEYCGERAKLLWLDIADDPADWPTPLMRRVTTKKKNRIKRIETLGNGQVPECAAVAFVYGFEILNFLLERNLI